MLFFAFGWFFPHVYTISDAEEFSSTITFAKTTEAFHCCFYHHTAKQDATAFLSISISLRPLFPVSSRAIAGLFFFCFSLSLCVFHFNPIQHFRYCCKFRAKDCAQRNFASAIFIMGSFLAMMLFQNVYAYHIYIYLY